MRRSYIAVWNPSAEVFGRCGESGKVIYPTKKDAETARNSRQKSKRRGKYTELRIYDCPYCSGWHLSHKRTV